MWNFLQIFGASCANYSPTFFGFPTWYKYLVNANLLEADCSLSQDFTLMSIWLIAAAIIEMMIYVAGIIAVVMIMWGGFRFITSQGSPDTTKEARNTILYAIIGLIVSISARALMNLVLGIF